MIGMTDHMILNIGISKFGGESCHSSPRNQSRGMVEIPSRSVYTPSEPMGMAGRAFPYLQVEGDVSMAVGANLERTVLEAVVSVWESYD